MDGEIDAAAAGSKRKRTPTERATLAAAAATGRLAAAAPAAALPVPVPRTAPVPLPKPSAPVPVPQPASAQRHAGNGGALPRHSLGGTGAASSPPVPRGPHSAPAAVRPRGAFQDADGAICLDFDEEDPLSFFLAQNIPKAVAEAALAACGNDPERAQVWLMNGGARRLSSGGAPPPPSRVAAPPGRGGAVGAAGHAAAPAGGQDEDEDEDDEAAFQRDLERAQLASEALNKQEARAREAAFVASARLEPLATFSDSSVFLAAARGAAGAADGAAGTSAPAALVSDDELCVLSGPLADLLLLERQALRAFGDLVKPYFRRQGAALAALAQQDRAAFLSDRARDVGDPSRPGSMNGMPVRGRAGGLPAVFDGDDDGALRVSDDEVVVLD